MPGLCDSHFDPKYQQRYQASLENIQKSRSETLRILACEHDTRQPHHLCKSMNQDMHSSLKERGCVESIHERTHGAMIYSQGHVSHLIHDYHRGSKASIRCKFNETDIHTHINKSGAVVSSGMQRVGPSQHADHQLQSHAYQRICSHCFDYRAYHDELSRSWMYAVVLVCSDLLLPLPLR